MSASLAGLFSIAAFADENSASKAELQEPWLVYYSDKAAIEEFKDYSLIVFDSKYHPPLKLINSQHRTVLGYISLGEVNEHRSYFQAVKQENILLRENKNWPGSFMVDLRSTKWAERVIEELIPGILSQGFDGIFIDTLDNAAYLESLDRSKYKGMTQAAVSLIKNIRKNYPTIKIMLNRAYELLDQVGSDIDMELGESVYAQWDFAKKKYRLVDEKTHAQQVQILSTAMKKHPQLEIFSLDYWDPADKEGLKRIYAKERKNGFRPYVTSHGLIEIVVEPG